MIINKRCNFFIFHSIIFVDVQKVPRKTTTTKKTQYIDVFVFAIYICKAWPVPVCYIGNLAKTAAWMFHKFYSSFKMSTILRRASRHFCDVRTTTNVNDDMGNEHICFRMGIFVKNITWLFDIQKILNEIHIMI